MFEKNSLNLQCEFRIEKEKILNIIATLKKDEKYKKLFEILAEEISQKNKTKKKSKTSEVEGSEAEESNALESLEPAQKRFSTKSFGDLIVRNAFSSAFSFLMYTKDEKTEATIRNPYHHIQYKNDDIKASIKEIAQFELKKLQTLNSTTQNSKKVFNYQEDKDRIYIPGNQLVYNKKRTAFIRDATDEQRYQNKIKTQCSAKTHTCSCVILKDVACKIWQKLTPQNFTEDHYRRAAAESQIEATFFDPRTFLGLMEYITNNTKNTSKQEGFEAFQPKVFYDPCAG